MSLFYLVYDGDEGDRTLDLMTASHALSQLSYAPEISNKQTKNYAIIGDKSSLGIKSLVKWLKT